MFAREVAAAFEREYGCTLADWQRCLPEAVGTHPLARHESGAAEVTLGTGRLQLAWRELAPRRIALASFPRLAVSFRFERVEATPRQQFMRHFDLALQRGGG